MIDISKVLFAYQGEVGCMCGCLGTYHISSHYGIKQANKDIKYEAYSECNDEAIAEIVETMNSLINWNNPKKVNECVQDDITIVDNNGERWAVYFKYL